MKCRVCGSDVDLLEDIKNCRIESIRYDDVFHPYMLHDIVLYCCPYCTHVQSKYNLSDSFYDNYVYNAGFMQYIHKDTFKQKVNKLKKYCNNNKELLEIGCGIGGFLELAQNEFVKCVGVEPAENTAKIAVSRGLNVIHEYFNSSLHFKQKFDAIVWPFPAQLDTENERNLSIL